MDWCSRGVGHNRLGLLDLCIVDSNRLECSTRIHSSPIGILKLCQFCLPLSLLLLVPFLLLFFGQFVVLLIREVHRRISYIFLLLGSIFGSSPPCVNSSPGPGLGQLVQGVGMGLHHLQVLLKAQ